MPQIRPITDLRNTNEISEICHAQKEPVFITKNGYGDLVVMSMETYESMPETAKTDAAILEAETEYARDGILHDARSAFDSLRKGAYAGKGYRQLFVGNDTVIYRIDEKRRQVIVITV